MELITEIQYLFLETMLDVLPIAAIIFGFQFLVIRKPIPNLKKVLTGLFYVLIGITLFLLGLEQALFPLGRLMAEQLTDPAFMHGAKSVADEFHWQDYFWVYIFAFAIGMSTTIALGVAIGIALGTYRIVTGTPIHYYIIAGYVVVVIQTFFAPKLIVPLAYDSGGVTTSTVTVPLVAALGLGLAETVPGRSPLIDGFGLIAFASLFPMISVMAYAQLSEFRAKRARKKSEMGNRGDD
ncbi:MAG: DUF1538 domain-containing protein [Gammaproteobacteria bacterium]|jgi:hypothetical protein